MLELCPAERKLFINQEKVIEIAMREYDRMGVNSNDGQSLFKQVVMDELSR